MSHLLSTNEDGTYQLPSLRQLNLFERTRKAHDGPSIDRFELELGGSSTATLWNKRAAYVFADYFVAQPDVIHTSAKIVRQVFRTHLKALAKGYRSQTVPPEETDEMVAKVQAENTRKAKDYRQRLVSQFH